jgi:hypothetical protein
VAKKLNRVIKRINMKKLFLSAMFVASIVSCNNNSGGEDVTTSDTSGQKNPDGIVNSSRISTDSAAYRPDTTTNKKAEKLVDSVFKK